MDEKKPYLAVILVQAIYAGMFLLTKAAFNSGMNSFVFVFYRQAAGTIFLAPIAAFFEWKKAQPLSFVNFGKIFLLSLFGITLSLDVHNMALVYTTATLAAATTNCLPVITFFLAVLFRKEAFKVRTTAGAAKLAGIIVCVAGVATLAFSKGPDLKLLGLHHLLGHPKIQDHDLHLPSSTTWIKGCSLFLVSITLWGLWLVLQASVMKNYPSKLLFITLQCFLSTIQSFAIAFAFERDPEQWKLGWNVRLLTVAYCGIVVTGVAFYLQACVLEKKGPVFLAMSTPLALIMTLFFSVILLGEIITLGSLLGAMLLVGGLYSVLWGKSREQKANDGNSLTAEVDNEDLEQQEVVASKTPPA